MKASVQRIEPSRAGTIRLPFGESDSDRRAQINPNFITPVHVVEKDDQDQFVAVEIGELPLGTRELYVQHRMCGDFYCFIHGDRQVNAIGDTPTEAFKNALKLAA